MALECLKRISLYHFAPIKTGRFTVSVQASAGHYSSPRADGLSQEYYNAFEVAIFIGDKWILPARAITALHLVEQIIKQLTKCKAHI